MTLYSPGSIPLRYAFYALSITKNGCIFIQPFLIIYSV